MLGIDIGRVPLPAYSAPLTRAGLRARERQWCQFVLDRLRERLGPRGTLLVPAYSYSCGAPGSTFDTASTPSEVGPFTEFMRGQANAVRSAHPRVSLAGEGADAPGLLEQCGRSAFGAASPFGRFAEFGVRFLCLGAELRHCITYVHHLEQCYGCVHRYHKAFDVTVVDAGRVVEGPWSAYVGYRGLGYTSDLSALQEGLRSANCLREVEWRGRVNHLADIGDVDRVGYDVLVKDGSAFVDRRVALRFDEVESSSQVRLDLQIHASFDKR